ncbi:MAG: YozE family protein [Candidatus Dormibacteria bacterium]
MTAADAMRAEPRGSFRAWLVAQADRNDAIGDLARDVWQDPCLRQARTPAGILRHIRAEHFPCEAALTAFGRALAEWAASPRHNSDDPSHRAELVREREAPEDAPKRAQPSPVDGIRPTVEAGVGE